jgi:hypothetical protein
VSGGEAAFWLAAIGAFLWPMGIMALSEKLSFGRYVIIAGFVFWLPALCRLWTAAVLG